ncbi:WYL domain-containing protein [Butyrivibrio sp. ob235]|uniref:helix-turn-helix transcriptional regulator n=1 Tax=Butyrivibrio sp. ob235 TaxID=1761780 RepID=UPI0008D3F0F9|nr:WYL domain-containing protein [Butyrivibrio sp. ob235]SEM01994.1 WYL domain-containing protein [Butyrivibrio sp. ob235]
MSKSDAGKERRVLDIYTELMNGKVISKAEMADKYGVDIRSIQRDLADIRSFIQESTIETGVENDLVYDAKAKGFRLEQTNHMKFTNDEVLAICKILLDSRAFRKDDMMLILDKLLDCCVPKKNQKMVNDLISNEKFHYIPPQHNKHFLGNMWNLGQAINESFLVEYDYMGFEGHSEKHRTLEPLAIMFSDYYFYLVGNLHNFDKKSFKNPDDMNPTIYRIDKIKNLKITDEHFKLPYSTRFEAGEFRKRIQFMFGGKLRRIKFEYSGKSVEAVLDRLPTAKIIEEKDGVYTIQAEVFGDGIDMWLRSQGKYVSLLSNS